MHGSQDSPPLRGYRTPRNPDALTHGPGAAHVLAGLGHRPMPWQRHLLDVAGEVTADGTRLAYPYVVLDVPRRAGKTAGVFACALHRETTARGYRAFYTAQTRADAALVFREDWTPLLASSPLSRWYKVRASNGSESITLPPRASSLTLFAPGPKALHGQASDLAIVDEAWAFTTDQGDALEAAIQPAQSTRPYRQLWIVSAGGTHESTWLRRWIDLGEQGTPGVALIRYAADPDVDDPDDPDLVLRVHPAVGHTLEADVAVGLRSTMPRLEYLRAFCGLWTTPDAAPATIPVDRWRADLDVDAAPGDPVTFGLAVAVNGAAAAIGAAGRYVDDDGLERIAVEVVEAGPGTAWVPDAWRAIRSRTRGRLLADALSPAADTIDALRDARLPVETMTTGDYTTACAAFVRDVVEGVVVHRGQPALDAAVDVATSRNVGDRWVWDRRAGGGVELLEAVSVAAAGARRPRRAPTVTPHTPA
jgi:hypothetical protein